jgi:hypothetical protein
MQQLAAWQRSQKQLASKVMCKLGSCYDLWPLPYLRMGGV